MVRCSAMTGAPAFGWIERPDVANTTSTAQTCAVKVCSRATRTVFGFEMGVIFMGAIVTETVFGWPGLGRLMYDSIMSRDYPMVTGLFFLISATVIAVNIIVDVVYAILDPRIRYT